MTLLRLLMMGGSKGTFIRHKTPAVVGGFKGFKDLFVLCENLYWGKMVTHFDDHIFSDGLVQPPTSR